MSELRRRIRQVTQELNTLLEELTQSQRHGHELVETAASGEVLRDFRSAIDGVRHLVWAYLEASARANPNEFQYAVQSLRFQRAIEMLRSLREGGVRAEIRPSFIEHVNALVDGYEQERIANRRLT